MNITDENTVYHTSDLSFKYGDKTALDSVSVRIRKGERVALLGANASGKSTLLALMDGLLLPSSGSIKVFGRELCPVSLNDRRFVRHFRSQVAILFQNPDVQLFSDTVRDELAFVPLQLGLSWPEVREVSRSAAEIAGITDLMDRPPHTLSGGEKKRVALASMLTADPSVILLDEPTTGMDPRTQHWFIELMEEFAAGGRTIIVSTHDLALLPELADRALVLGEDHRIAADADAAGILADLDLLLSVNLIHEHTHRHGMLKHTHPHLHAMPYHSH
ncbi:MAG: ABC transporter ATP-binding protein [bacterium]|nr:ABC transporter ATP-binding protein [bacterium]